MQLSFTHNPRRLILLSWYLDFSELFLHWITFILPARSVSYMILFFKWLTADIIPLVNWHRELNKCHPLCISHEGEMIALIFWLPFHTLALCILTVFKLQSKILALVKHRRVSRNWSRGGHFSKFSTRVAKMSISISWAYSHGEVYIRMLLTYSIFLRTYRETIHMSPTAQCTLIWWYTKSNFPYLEWDN